AVVRQHLLKWAPIQATPVVDLKNEREYEQSLAAIALARVSPEQVWEEIVGVPQRNSQLGAGSALLGRTLPFWLDYLVPVAVGSVILFTAWWTGLKFLLTR